MDTLPCFGQGIIGAAHHNSTVSEVRAPHKNFLRPGCLGGGIISWCCACMGDRVASNLVVVHSKRVTRTLPA